MSAASGPAAAPQRPAPNASRDGAFFWEGCKRGVLLGQRCASCKRFRFPPRPMCPHCQSVEREEVELSGRATLYSWAKPVHPPLPMFPPGYLIALVELEEGMRMLSNLCDVEPADIEVGMPLEVFFAPTADGGAVHQFRPRRPR
ncbi:MAG: Zn-ribbon domain-containing OB-fold protein [Myxococcota bacterium]|nr:Zn-ribbon domain-containing OB-fold protein [Myxococcales bacterium]